MKNFKLSFLAAIAFLLFFSCNKEDESKTPQAQTPPVLYENVKIIDSTNLELDLTQSQLDNGIYQFTATGTMPTISDGDVIVGDEGEGFLRKVTSSVVNGNTITLQTTQGAMTDLFKEGGFDFNLDMNDMVGRGTAGFSHTINNKNIYQEGPLSIILNNGQVDFNPNWFFDFKFDDTGINFFEISAKNATLNGDFTATITAAQAVTLIDRSSSILPNSIPKTKIFTKYVSAWVPVGPILVLVTVPIKVRMDLDLVLDYSATVSAAISRQAKFTSNNTFNLGVNYSNGQWNDINSFSPANNFTLQQRAGNASATINLALTPKVSFKLYGVVGPYAHVSLMEQLSGAVASPSLDWDFKADVWLKSKAGINDVSILGYNFQGYSKTWETSKLTYLTPYKIEKVDGDNQTGNFGQQLGAPIKVRIVDNLNRVQSNVPVYFTISSGGGTVQTTSILTDANGFAQTLWTLGAAGTQTVNVSAKKADGTALLQSPVSFTATGTAPGSIVGTWKLESLYELGVCRSCVPENQIINCFGIIKPPLTYVLFDRDGYSGQSGGTNTGCQIKGSPSCDWNYKLIFNSNYINIIDGCTGIVSPNVNYTYNINNNSFSYENMDGVTFNCEILELNNSVLKYKYNYLYGCLSQPTEQILTFQRQ